MTEIKEQHKKEFIECIDRLNKLMKKIQKYCPDANYYLSTDSMNLMKGPSHIDDTNRGFGIKQQQNVAASKMLKFSGGGDW